MIEAIKHLLGYLSRSKPVSCFPILYEIAPAHKPARTSLQRIQWISRLFSHCLRTPAVQQHSRSYHVIDSKNTTSVPLDIRSNRCSNIRCHRFYCIPFMRLQQLRRLDFRKFQLFNLSYISIFCHDEVHKLTKSVTSAWSTLIFFAGTSRPALGFESLTSRFFIALPKASVSTALLLPPSSSSPPRDSRLERAAAVLRSSAFVGRGVSSTAVPSWMFEGCGSSAMANGVLVEVCASGKWRKWSCLERRDCGRVRIEWGKRRLRRIVCVLGAVDEKAGKTGCQNSVV